MILRTFSISPGFGMEILYMRKQLCILGGEKTSVELYHCGIVVFYIPNTFTVFY